MKIVYLMSIIALLAGCQTTREPIPSSNMGSQTARKSLLVIGEDGFLDAISRNSGAFKSLQSSLAEEMTGQGFAVYDEAAVTLNDFSRGRTRRTDAEVIDIARSANFSRIDAAAVLAIYTKQHGQGKSRKLQVRVTGRLFNVRNGRRLDAFQIQMRRPVRVAAICDSDCRSDVVRRNAGELALDLASVMAARLNGDALTSLQSGRTISDPKPEKDRVRSGFAVAYSLKFVGFSPTEMTVIEDRITNFVGFEHYQPISASLRTNEYWYETVTASAVLNRNLRHMLEEMSIAGRLTFGGNYFRVDKITVRKRR